MPDNLTASFSHKLGVENPVIELASMIWAIEFVRISHKLGVEKPGH